MTSNILWDWNGTLLNDASNNLRVVNILLRNRNLPEINLDEYRNSFSIPMIDFYYRVGFTFAEESFEQVAQEYVDLYHLEYDTVNLTSGIEKVLKQIKEKGLRQFIISATGESYLHAQVNKKGITQYFEEMVGNDNNHGKSKIQKAMEFMKKTQLKTAETLFIGDTEHDYEVAQQIGVKCILYNRGHQNILPNDKYAVIEKIEEVLEHI